MKKSRFLGYALTLAATLVVGSAMGQDVAGGTDYVEIGGTTHADAAYNKKSFITVNKTLGFYALPDKAFHTGYDAGNGWKLLPDFEWNWDLSGAAAVSSVKGPAMTPAKPANYVELTSSSIGVKTIKVKEKSSPAFGGCEDATGTTFTLVVFDKPTIDFETGAGIGGRPLTEVCGNVTGWKVNLKISATDFVTAKFKLEEYPVTLDVDGTPTPGTVRSAKTIDYNTAKLAAGSTYKKTAGTDEWTLSGSAFDYDNMTANRVLTLSQTRGFDVVGTDVITLYKYTIVDGVNDFVSRKSDNGGTETFYPGTAATQTISIYVKRAPKTGPVYHINNNVAK